MKKLFFILAATLLVIVVVMFWHMHQRVSVSTIPPLYKTTALVMGQGSYQETFTAEIADTSALQELGLSNRQSIDQNAAMIFVFPSPGRYNFWMKDMNFPIDIIWLNSDKKIIYIEKNLAPSTYPNSFGPDTNSQYVVEVKAALPTVFISL